MTSSAAYIAEAQKRNIQIGYSIEIEGIAIVFSNVVVPGVASNDQENIINNERWNPAKLSIDTTRISIGTISVDLIDTSGTLLAEYAAGTLNRKKMTLKRGFGNLDVAEWNVLNVFTIYEVGSGDQNRLTIKGRDRITELKKPIILPDTKLNADISDVDTQVPGIFPPDAEFDLGFPTSGSWRIDEEISTYTTLATSVFNSQRTGTNVAHDEGDTLQYVQVIQENPVDILLQLMISKGGGITGSIYDVLPVGLGIDETTIDVAQFESIRDNSSLTGDVWLLTIRDSVDDALKLFEEQIFQFANLRIFINDEGKFSLALLNEVTLASFAGDLLEEDIIVIPKCSINSDRIFNQLVVEYDHDPEKDSFVKLAVFNDADSQAEFGIIPVKANFRTQGIRTGFDGLGLLQVFANSFFRRVGTPFGKIKQVKTLWKKQFFKAGDKIQFTHAKVKNFATGAIGIVKQFVEIISPKFDFQRGITTYEINNSPSLSDMWAFISPSSLIDSGVFSQTVFDIEAGEGARAEWTAGQFITLWLIEGGSGPISTAEILSVSTDTITLVGPGFSITPTTAHRIRYADFDSVTENQKIFAFVSDGNNDFPDGTPPYKIS